MSVMVSVLKWIRAFGNEVQALKRSDSPPEFVEIDEMHTYVGKKTYCWLWIAVD